MIIEFSTGELADNVTILVINPEMFKDEAKRANFKKEYDMLTIS